MTNEKFNKINHDACALKNAQKKKNRINRIEFPCTRSRWHRNAEQEQNALGVEIWAAYNNIYSDQGCEF